MTIPVQTKIDLTTKTFSYLHDLVTEAVAGAKTSDEFSETHYALMQEIASNLNKFYLSRNSEKV